MQTLLFSMKLRRPIHAVAFRERARQAARLLRFNPADQATIAAAAFLVAYQGLAELLKPRLVLGIDQGNLRLEALGRRRPEGAILQPVYHFIKPLPAPLELTPTDLAWIVAQVHAPRATSVFEEMNRQNQEFLALAHALQERERELAQLRAATSAA